MDGNLNVNKYHDTLQNEIAPALQATLNVDFQTCFFRQGGTPPRNDVQPDQMDTMNKLSSVLMIAHYTLKYFDMSQTEMRDGVFQALSLHVANNNSQLVKVYVAPMCLYMIEWQLKDLPSLIASNDRVAKLEQQVNDLVNALNRFLHATNSNTRAM
ncbi:hypothetical protein J6590_094437, partial [Homalodisca vitripennis]